MPIIKSAIKRVKQANAARERNIATKRAIRTAMKAFTAKPTSQGLSAVHSELDKALKKNLLHKNTVARRKAAVAKLAKDAGVKLAPAAKKVSTAKKPAAKAAAKPTTAKKTAAKPVAKKAAVAKKPAAKKTPAKK